MEFYQQHSPPNRGHSSHSHSQDKGAGLWLDMAYYTDFVLPSYLPPLGETPGEKKAQAHGLRGWVRRAEAGANVPLAGEGSCPLQDSTTRPTHDTTRKPVVMTPFFAL